jgi:two-component system, NtrC family, sensor histidine kinase KinB
MKKGDIKSEQLIEGLQEDLSIVSTYLNDLFTFLPLPICGVTPRGVICNVNKAFEELSNFSASEILGERLNSFFQAEKDIGEILKVAERKKITKNNEAILITKEGKKISVSISCAVKQNKQGESAGFFLSFADISAFKILQEETEIKIKQRTMALKESRRALLNILEDTEMAKKEAETERNKAETIFYNFVDGLLILDENKRFNLINPTAEDYLDIRQNDYLGKTFILLKEKKELKRLFKIVSFEKEIMREEFELLKEEITLEVSTRFISIDEKQQITLIILHNVTREKMIERLKSQFVSVAAHQLRTPLSIIKWSLSMLLEGEAGLLTSNQKDMVSKANETNERMIRLINDLLNVARIEEGRFVYQPKTVDLIELLDDIVESIQTMAYSKGVKFKFIKPKDKKSKIIKVDIEKASLAIRNLLENAVHYTNSNGKVILKAERKGDRVFVSVQDTGIGISKDQQDRVFSKFFRGNNAVRTETEGTGLGLFITKNIIEAHDGKISFESEENKGTTFIFSLPAIG